MVTPDSATRGKHSAQSETDEIFPIDETHSNMVKFSENDPNLEVVTAKLSQIISQRGLIKAITEDTKVLSPQVDVSSSQANNQGGYPWKTHPSYEGLLRSILPQIISSCPELCRIILRFFSQGFLNWDSWSLPKLTTVFHEILKQEEIPLYLCLFLDALDEYDGPKEFICKFIQDLNAIRPTETKTIKICFSSRPWDIFVAAFQPHPGISIQDFTVEDIRDYCLGSIREEHLLEMALEDLIPDIVMRSRGVFLWVKLVIRDLLDATRTKQMSKTECKTLLESYPTELDSYYTEIIERIPRTHRWKAYVMLEVAVRSVESLTPHKFLLATHSSEHKTFQGAVTESDRYQETENNIMRVKQDSRAYTGGLIEVIQGSQYKYIQVLHQTVEDFVRDPNFKKLVLGEQSKITFENGNTFLAKSWFYVPQDGDYRGRKLAASYLRSAEQTTGRSIKTFIDSVPCNILGRRRPGQGSVSLTPFCFAATMGLHLYVKESLLQAPNLLRDYNEPLLSRLVCFSVSRSETVFQTAQLLLSNGFTLDQDPTAFPLLLILPNDYVKGWGDRIHEHRDQCQTLLNSLACLFLDNGQRVDIMIEFYNGTRCTPLHISRLPIAKKLVEKGANVNTLSSDKSTPLDYWSEYGDATKYRRLNWDLGFTFDNQERYETIRYLVE